ncbi:MAG: hypothetical protein AAF958_12070 [Planctomycetota bacterium]
MPSVASYILSATLFGFAWWLGHHESSGWPEEAGSDLDAEYKLLRRRRRARIHGLFYVAAFLIAVAGVAGTGRIWIACWMSVMLILIAIVFLALLDGFRTHRYFKQKLPRIRQRLSDDF